MTTPRKSPKPPRVRSAEPLNGPPGSVATAKALAALLSDELGAGVSVTKAVGIGLKIAVKVVSERRSAKDGPTTTP